MDRQTNRWTEFPYQYSASEYPRTIQMKHFVTAVHYIVLPHLLGGGIIIRIENTLAHVTRDSDTTFKVKKVKGQTLTWSISP